MSHIANHAEFILDNKDRAVSRASDWLVSRRGSNEPVMKELQAYIKTVFLEIVRVQYWKQISAGKLPRESYATQTLLYSIENALDRTHKVLKELNVFFIYLIN